MFRNHGRKNKRTRQRNGKKRGGGQGRGRGRRTTISNEICVTVNGMTVRKAGLRAQPNQLPRLSGMKTGTIL